MPPHATHKESPAPRKSSRTSGETDQRERKVKSSRRMQAERAAHTPPLPAAPLSAGETAQGHWTRSKGGDDIGLWETGSGPAEPRGMTPASLPEGGPQHEGKPQKEPEPGPQTPRKASAADRLCRSLSVTGAVARGLPRQCDSELARPELGGPSLELSTLCKCRVGCGGWGGPPCAKPGGGVLQRTTLPGTPSLGGRPAYHWKGQAPEGVPSVLASRASS